MLLLISLFFCFQVIAEGWSHQGNSWLCCIKNLPANILNDARHHPATITQHSGIYGNSFLATHEVVLSSNRFIGNFDRWLFMTTVVMQQCKVAMVSMATIATCDVMLLSNMFILHYNNESWWKILKKLIFFRTTTVKGQQCKVTMVSMTTIAACDVILLCNRCILHYNSESLTKNIEDVKNLLITKVKK